MSATTIIEKFGGVKGLADRLADFTGRVVPLTTVRYWLEVDRIPSGRQGDVLATARANGLEITPSDFFKPPSGPRAEQPPLDEAI